MDITGKNNQDFDKAKSMKMIKNIIIILVILFIMVIAIIGVIYYLQQKEFKVYIDGKSNTTITQSDVFIIDGENVYVSIKEFAKYVNYTAYNGEYKQYSEDNTSCYLQNDNEVVTYTLDSSTIYKTILSETVKDDTTTTATTATNNASINYEYFTIDEPVIMINNKLYTTIEGISIGCNIYIERSEADNSISIYTLDYLAKGYASKITSAVITGEQATFSNKKAVLYDLVVIQNTAGEYGVINTSKEEVIGEKYASIKFLESSQEFIVKTSEGKTGIIAKDGTTKIKPEYDDIKQIDKDTGLYLVSNNNKYGVVNKSGQVIIYMEYDKIGIDTAKFDGEDIKNSYLLYDSCIPVYKGEKWGLINKNGKVIVETKYDSLGCIIGSTTSKIANNLLLIPEYEAIVVCENGLYGIINSSGKELIPSLVTDMYAITSAGKKSYYLTYNGQTLDVIDYLQNTLGIDPVNKNTTVTDENLTVDDNTHQ